MLSPTALPMPPVAPLIAPQDSTGHWYDKLGNPCHTYVNDKGEEKKTTLLTAKKHGWFPSFSGVCQAMAKPGLENYKLEQMLLASLTLERLPGESLDDFARRAVADAETHREEAAATGTATHWAVECELQGRAVDPVFELHAYNAAQAIERFHNTTRENIICEHTFAHPLGWGGTCDQHSRIEPDGVLSDVKTKPMNIFDVQAVQLKADGLKPMHIAAELKTRNEDLHAVRDRVLKAHKKLSLYEQHFMQLGAYREGLGLPNARGAIIFVSTEVPGLNLTVEAKQEEMAWGWKLFSTLFEFWKTIKKYDPLNPNDLDKERE